MGRHERLRHEHLPVYAFQPAFMRYISLRPNLRECGNGQNARMDSYRRDDTVRDSNVAFPFVLHIFKTREIYRSVSLFVQRIFNALGTAFRFSGDNDIHAFCAHAH